MKRLFLLLIFIGLFFSANSQSTYSKRLHFGFKSAVLTSMVVTDSCFYAIGLANDSISPYRLGSLFVKFDFDGNVLLSKLLTKPYYSIRMWRNCLTPISDGNFMLGGAITDTVSNYAAIIKYTPEGDTIFTKLFSSPNFPEDPFITLMDITGDNQTGFYIVANIDDPIQRAEIFVTKVDSLGEINWDNIYGADFISDAAWVVTKGLDNNVLIGGVYTNSNFVNQDYIA